jgi:hypothetical protein
MTSAVQLLNASNSVVAATTHNSTVMLVGIAAYAVVLTVQVILVGRARDEYLTERRAAGGQPDIPFTRSEMIAFGTRLGNPLAALARANGLLSANIRVMLQRQSNSQVERSRRRYLLLTLMSYAFALFGALLLLLLFLTA